MTATPEDLTLLTPERAAELLALTRSQVMGLVRGGKIPTVRISARCFRIPAADLAAWIEEHRVDGDAADRRIEARRSMAMANSGGPRGVVGGRR